MIRYLDWLKSQDLKTPYPRSLPELPQGSRQLQKKDDDNLDGPSGSFGSDPGIGVLEREGGRPDRQNAYPAALPELSQGAPPWVHPQLQNALARELWDDGGPEKTWLIDTSTRAKSALLDQMPEGVDLAAWREAVFKLSDSITASGRLVGRAYDDQPLITLKVPIVENQASETALGASKQKSGTET
jgi:hypothetical protein